VVFGLLSVAICFPMIHLVKNRWKVDDLLDVFAVHGVGGMIGSILLAASSAPALGGTGYATGMDFARQLHAQILGVASPPCGRGWPAWLWHGYRPHPAHARHAG
jgi:Amt family ammonium transporter